MAKKFPIHPAHPERTCWGCDRYCPSDSLACGNGSERTQHPVETWGDDWQACGLDAVVASEMEVDEDAGRPPAPAPSGAP
jgi:hypothetical protein